jgi:hypothetical protein
MKAEGAVRCPTYFTKGCRVWRGIPTPEGFDAYTLILWTKDRRFECIADHQSLLKLAASIQTHVVPPKYLIS